MNSRVVRSILIVVGTLAVLVGIVFGGQGAGLIPGSSMTGDRTWLYIGIVLAVIGVILIVLGARRPKRT